MSAGTLAKLVTSISTVILDEVDTILAERKLPELTVADYTRIGNRVGTLIKAGLDAVVAKDPS